MSALAPIYSGPPEDIAAILRAVSAWEAATRAGNHSALLDLVTEDCVFLAPGVPPIQGRGNLAPLVAALAQYKLEPLFSLHELVVAGDWAFGWGKDEHTATPLTGGSPTSAKGWAVTILRRGSDQKWRFARGINTKLEGSSPPGGAT
jgi:uncharacterized protein (TIGR02246 family)